MSQSIRQLLSAATAALAAAGIDAAAHEARILAAHALSTDQAALLRTPERRVDPTVFDALLARRLTREPIAYVIGQTGFWSLTLDVSPATLIPRPDSETLIEAALAARPDRAAIRSILDLGTGTGCLLLAALTEYPAAWGLGTDRVEAACRLAARNAAANHLAARTAIVCADWAAPLHASFDLILANPPYIPSQDIAALMPEVAGFEPASALDGGPDGLSAYRTLIALLPGLLTPGGLAVFELGAGQAPPVRALAEAAGYHAATRADLGGHARALMLHRGRP